MPRKSFAIRHLKSFPPDEETARKYLMHWTAGDLYRHLETFPAIRSRELFGDDRPLELEVGCGTGEFLCYLAENEPSTNFVGVDMSLKSIYIGVERARALGLGNIKFIRAAVQYAYPLMAPESLAAVYLHFPDPCLHPKFRKKRLFNAVFLDNVFRALVEGGELSIMTDKPELFQIMLAQLEQDKRFEKAHSERYLRGTGWEAKSRYQVTWERRGMEPMRVLVRKKSHGVEESSEQPPGAEPVPV